MEHKASSSAVGYEQRRPLQCVCRNSSKVARASMPAHSARGKSDPHLDFNLAYPKRAFQISVDLAQNRATVRQVDRSFWSALRISHTFSGSRYNAPETHRDWIVTSVWVVAMDALAIGLLVMVFGSYYMWYRLKSKRTFGWIVLSAGVVSCGLFLFGLSMFT